MRPTRPPSFRAHASHVRRQVLGDGRLPFADVRTEGVLADALAAAGRWPDRIVSPRVTRSVVLGRVPDPDHSCRAAVARMNARRAATGRRPRSARTGPTAGAAGGRPRPSSPPPPVPSGGGWGPGPSRAGCGRGGEFTCATGPRSGCRTPRPTRPPTPRRPARSRARGSPSPARGADLPGRRGGRQPRLRRVRRQGTRRGRPAPADVGRADGRGRPPGRPADGRPGRHPPAPGPPGQPAGQGQAGGRLPPRAAAGARRPRGPVGQAERDQVARPEDG
jgi:hypothetical protein